MNLSQIRAFVAVVEHGSFSEAARVLGLSQPAVTQQIQGLESTLEATLFDRHYRRVDLTEAGRELLPYARKVLEELDEARNALDRLADEVTGRLAIESSTTPGTYVLPRLVGDFLEENPGVGVTLLIHDTAAVVAAVEAGEADLGMTGAKLRGTHAHFEECGTDSLVMICPVDDELAGRRDLSLEDVVQERFVIREAGSGTRSVMEEAFASAGIDAADLDVVMELGTSEAVVTAVEGGVGLGVVSRYMASKAIELGTIAELGVAHFPVARPFYLVTPKGTPSRAADAFADFLRAVL